MSKYRSKNKRQFGLKPYRKRYVIIPEGEAEKNYFNDLKIKLNNVIIDIRESNKGKEPISLLEYIIKNISTLKKDFLKDDELWLVYDTDNRPEAVLEKVDKECKENNFYNAVSNPKFEYWILLHFENGDGANLNNCIDKLKKYLPNYEKNHLEMEKVYPKIIDAIKRAKIKDNPPCQDRPRINGSTVYRLVEKLMESDN
jgi:hypothetical protein